jgi:hypothetical protein
MNLLLVRDLDNGRCSLGTLQLNGATYQTLERPWIGAAPGGVKGISCVPRGTYRLVRHDTEAHPRSFALVNEALNVYHLQPAPGHDGRTACLIHVANKPQELRGCIALGMERFQEGDEWTIRRSRLAVDRFYAALTWADALHTLEIS